MRVFVQRQVPILHALLIAALLTPLWAPAGAALANHTPSPASVNLAGDLESEATGLVCGDWDPACPASAFAAQGNDVYLFQSASIPAGSWNYKVAMGGWTENYGADFQPNGPNINLTLANAQSVRFYYDHKTHYIADNVRNTLYTVPGSFNSELGCGGDWDPACLRTFMTDADGDGIFTFVSTAIPAGAYEFKVATNESWNNPNYGQGGGGANVAFAVPAGGATVTVSFNTANNTPAVNVVPNGPGLDNNIFWDGLRHDSRDPLYRTPGGAAPAGTPVTLRFRTYHNDVTGVKVRVYSLNAGGQQVLPLSLAASDVDCYQPGLPYTCDFWAVTLPNATPDNLWYRFIVSDGAKTVYYADNTAALDGGLGAPSDNVVDNSYALMVYQPGFTAPAWAKNAVIYQIFPDRFRNGRKDNDPKTGDVRYDDPVLKLPWGTLPEGYCRNYADATQTTCPWRFGPPPAWGVNQVETPRGRDYQGGDLKGVDQQLDYLKALGVNTLYFNPIFDAGSNHGYDTQNYFKVDPYFGTQKDWDNLVKHANQLGIRIILDGVFNHLSSDSAFFDRYHHYGTVGACESVTSQYRSWFTFHDVPAGAGTCAGSAGPNSATYDGWFGFDSIPVLNKSNPEVQKYFIGQDDSVTTTWLDNGAAAWRLDVMGDASFPNGYWETFRQNAKQEKPSALIIGELWQKDSTLLRFLRGDRADTTMNYRLRDAVLGFLAPQAFDSKGFADSGRPIAPSEFLSRLASQREDYPDAAYYSLMNLLDSHDTERLLWTLTPGAATTAAKELNAANVAAGKQALRLASVIQYTLPGAPTVYYGDEVGVTGSDDPNDRRAYPWADLGGQPDLGLYQHYQALAQLRKKYPVLTEGSFQPLFADDANGVAAYGRKTGSQAALIVVNRGAGAQTSVIPVAGFLPDGVALTAAFTVGSSAGAASVANGQVSAAIGANSAVVLVTGRLDLTPPAAPAGLQAAEGNGAVTLTWNAVPDAAGYNVYRSPVTGGGYVKANTNPLTGLTFTDSGLQNARAYFYVVRALDAAGNESGPSNEATALPHLSIGWANLQWPPAMHHTLSTVNRTDTAYGQVWIGGATEAAGATPTLRAQLGFGPAGSQPAGNPAWIWVDAGFNTQAGNNDEFKASLLPEAAGSFDYVYRYTTTNGRDWLYADQNGPIAAGALPPNPGKLTVNASTDTAAPAAPANVRVTSASPAAVSLAWDAVAGDPTLYGYEVLRGATAGGPYTLVARLTDTSYTDADVVQDATYYYVVRSLDFAFNRSGNSPEVSALAAARTVSVVFNVTVPATTDATGRAVYIAGFLDRLDGGLPQWNPAGVSLTRADATHWTLTVTGKEYTQIEYKYVQGDWNFVEKDGSCGEIANRQLTLSYGAAGTQTVNDTVLNWRNVAPCGN